MTETDAPRFVVLERSSGLWLILDTWFNLVEFVMFGADRYARLHVVLRYLREPGLREDVLERLSRHMEVER